MAQEHQIILYHYPYSPYARRIVWYLNLRGIPYTQCLQPPILPRPDVVAIGTSYRRIPLVAIGRDIYNDTRLILSKLEALYPSHKSLSSSSPESQALERLLESWVVDGGIFARAAQLIPTNMPLFKDPKFTKDRESYTGRSWSREDVERARPEALVEIRRAVEILETTLLRDGREWVLGSAGPGLGDVEAIWPFHWLSTMKGALPASYISAEQFPMVFEWIARFDKAVREAAKTAGKPKTVTGKEAVAIIESSGFAEGEGEVDASDPLGLERGETVEVWPIDSGFSHKDRGRLVGLGGKEVVVESRTEGGKTVRVHAPRHGFRVRRVGGGGSKL